MGTETFNQHHHQQQQHQKNFQRNGKSAASTTSTNNKTFLPILCRSSSVKDTIIAHNPRHICPKKDDPSSPRVSCMGQVKHHNHHHATTNFKLLTPPSTTTIGKHPNKLFSGNTKLHLYNQKFIDQKRIRRPCTKLGTTSTNDNSATVVPLNLAELDPPLPVIKRLPQPCYDGGDNQPVSIWKRRSKEGGLTNLQIPRFQCIYATSTPLQFGPPTSL